MRLDLGYPTIEQEHAMLLRFERENPLDKLEPVTTPEEVVEQQRSVREVRVEESVRGYIVDIARATRHSDDLQLGVSPRGTLALYHCAQALAAIRGREFVLPDDVKLLAPYVLTHRVLVSPATRLRGRRLSEVLMDVVSTVPVPVDTD
jgi:MoxR-like ATPase